MDLPARPYQAVRKKLNLSPGALFALHYHHLFHYPLKKEELKKWEAGEALWQGLAGTVVSAKDGYFFLDAKAELVVERKIKEKLSQEKRAIAEKAARLLAKIPTVQMVGITGSLAMEAAAANDDIDLIIITSPGTLWTTRALSYLFLFLGGLSIRRFGEGKVKDKLCLNIWLDSDNLVWEKAQRNVYTAHEIAQIVPLVNKTRTYERFLAANAWHKKFWPNAVKVPRFTSKADEVIQKPNKLKAQLLFRVLEPLAYGLQYFYMRKKITREEVSRHKALFHPQDWSQTVAEFLKVDTP